jgi:DNA polymerase III delta prime subunit
MLDPKSAAKLGSSLGKGLSDQVFGIVDDVRNAKNIKAANNQRIINQNKITEINNQVVRNNNLLREQAMREIAAEQERDMLAKMSPAQREAFYKAKTEAAKEAKRLAREAEIKHEEMMELVWLCVFLFVFLPFIAWIGLLIWGMSDVMACYNMKGFVPLLKALCSH